MCCKNRILFFKMFTSADSVVRYCYCYSYAVTRYLKSTITLREEKVYLEEVFNIVPIMLILCLNFCSVIFSITEYKSYRLQQFLVTENWFLFKVKQFLFRFVCELCLSTLNAHCSVIHLRQILYNVWLKWSMTPSESIPILITVYLRLLKSSKIACRRSCLRQVIRNDATVAVDFHMS